MVATCLSMSVSYTQHNTKRQQEDGVVFIPVLGQSPEPNKPFNAHFLFILSLDSKICFTAQYDIGWLCKEDINM